MVHPWPLGVAVLLLIAVAICGCGGDARRASIVGTVTFNGEPLPEGAIAFIPTAGNKGPSPGAVVSDGHFEVPQKRGPFVGQNRVEIRASRETGRMIPDPRHPRGPNVPAAPLVPEFAEYIPEHYNDASTLVREVKQGRNTLDFDLKAE